MKNILLLGATGKLGLVLTKKLIDENYKVRALVRSSKKIQFGHKNLEVIEGNVTEKHELEKSLKNIDVVVSVLGHGFRTKYPIQKNVFENLLPVMEKNKVERLITVTGSAMNVEGDKVTKLSMVEEKIVSMIDPYRLKDARVQQDLLEKSNLDWTVVRTPIHSNKESKLENIGFEKPKFWKSVGRIPISKFIVECIEEDKWIKKSPVIY